jgi:hypothetical protein
MNNTESFTEPLFIPSASNSSSIIAYVSVAAEMSLLGRCQAMAAYFGSAIPAFNRHIKIL